MSSSALKAVATGQVAAPARTILDYLEHPKVAKGIAAVGGKFMTPERMLSLCINAVKKTPRLMQCDPQSVLGAMMASAALGLEPNTVQQQAFLIPYKKRVKVGNNWEDTFECQFQVGYRGFITLGYRSPHIARFTANAIHDGDHWKHMDGSKAFLEWSMNLANRGSLIGAYSHVELTSGRELACVLPFAEVVKIRSKSETYRTLVAAVDNAENAKDRTKAEGKLADTPWVLWEDDMAAKSAIKKHSKMLPIAVGDSLAAAAAIDDNGDTGTLDLAALADPDAVRDVVENGAELPALKDDASPTLHGSGEAYGTRDRVPAARAEGATDAPVVRQQQRQAATTHQPAQQPRDRPAGMAPGPEDDACWEPSEAEQASIRAREVAEAAGEQQQATQAPAQAPAQPTAAPQARTARRNQAAPE